MQNTGKIGCGTAAVFGVVALILLPAACSAMADAPEMSIPEQVVDHDTVVVVPGPRSTVTRQPAKPPAQKVPMQKAPRTTKR